MTVIDIKPGMSISDAASSAPEGAVLLRLFPGVYREKVFIKRDQVSIAGMGESPEDVKIMWGDYALEMMEDGKKRGTFRSYTFFIKGKNNSLKNLNIVNTSYPRKKAGQAIALFAEGERFTAENCILDSFQDTLFTGPLPFKEIEKGGFKGPTENDERVMCHQYYKDCRICGDVDFIFGSAACLFENCEIVSKNGNDVKTGQYPCEAEPVEISEDAIYGYCTAASTYEGEESGYIFKGCRFLNDGCPTESVYLGRPWRDHAKTVLIDCYLDDHIKREGFHDWGKTAARDTVYYAECGSHGPGASSERAAFVRLIDRNEAENLYKNIRKFL